MCSGRVAKLWGSSPVAEVSLESREQEKEGRMGQGQREQSEAGQTSWACSAVPFIYLFLSVVKPLWVVSRERGGKANAMGSGR